MDFNFDIFFEKYKDLIEGSNNKYNFYSYIIPKLVKKNKPIYILETGTMHCDLQNNQGAFTYIMSDLIKNYTGGKLFTVDISEDHLNSCKKNTEIFSDVIEYILSDSIIYLNKLTIDEISRFDLVYLDSYDLFIPNPEPSEKHHFKELLSIYTKLSDDCCISIDDNYLPQTVIYWNWLNDDGSFSRSENFYTGDKIIGKGKLCNEFLINNGWKLFEEFNVVGLNNVFYYEKII